MGGHRKIWILLSYKKSCLFSSYSSTTLPPNDGNRPDIRILHPFWQTKASLNTRILGAGGCEREIDLSCQKWQLNFYFHPDLFFPSNFSSSFFHSDLFLLFFTVAFQIVTQTFCFSPQFFSNFHSALYYFHSALFFFFHPASLKVNCLYIFTQNCLSLGFFQSSLQLQKHCKSVKLPWQHNTKLFLWSLSFCLFVFLSFCPFEGPLVRGPTVCPNKVDSWAANSWPRCLNVWGQHARAAKNPLFFT